MVLEADLQPDALGTAEGISRVRKLRYRSPTVSKNVLKHFEVFVQSRPSLTPMGFCQGKWFECLKQG